MTARDKGGAGSLAGPDPPAARMPSHYRIFLLTVWRDDSAATDKAMLRFSVHDPRSGQRRAFSDSQGLLAFLEVRLDAVDVADSKEPNE